MKKIVMIVMLLAGIVCAKPLVLDICKPTFCYVQKIENAKSWQWLTDFNGYKFVRVYLYGNGLIDIPAHNATVKVRK